MRLSGVCQVRGCERRSVLSVVEGNELGVLAMVCRSHGRALGHVDYPISYEIGPRGRVGPMFEDRSVGTCTVDPTRGWRLLWTFGKPTVLVPPKGRT